MLKKERAMPWSRPLSLPTNSANIELLFNKVRSAAIWSIRLFHKDVIFIFLSITTNTPDSSNTVYFDLTQCWHVLCHFIYSQSKWMNTKTISHIDQLNKALLGLDWTNAGDYLWYSNDPSAFINLSLREQDTWRVARVSPVCATQLLARHDQWNPLALVYRPELKQKQACNVNSWCASHNSERRFVWATYTIFTIYLQAN